MYSVEKEVKPVLGRQAEAVCAHCGHAHPFLRLPLFVVTGASGAGKSALLLNTVGQLDGYVPLEMDILWGPAFDQPQDDYREFRSVWLRMAKNIGQAGRPVVLFGSTVPEQFESNPERRYFSQIHYLALVCQPDILSTRLRARPGWRESGSADFLASMQHFNRWFIENAHKTSPPMTLLDTSQASLVDALQGLRTWLITNLPPE
jgi:hypothetical protein